MTTTTDNEKYENALKSLEAKRKLSEARGYAAGASILANNNPKFIRCGIFVWALFKSGLVSRL